MSDATLLKGVNHVTLCVSDLARSLDFYQRLLGCVLRAEWARGAYLEAGSLWLCLELPAAPFILSRPDDSHLAFTVDACGFAILRDRLTGQVRLWKENTSEGDSLYFLDPDGHKLEIHVGSLATRLAAWHL